MKNLVVSLEITKKLKEAGWKKETAFYWAFLYDAYSKDARIWMLKYKFPLSLAHGIPIHPAPTLGELVRELPAQLILLTACDSNDKNEYFIIDDRTDTDVASASTPEDAAALAWIALQKEKE